MKRQHLGTFAIDVGLILIGAPEAFRDEPEIGQRPPSPTGTRSAGRSRSAFRVTPSVFR